MNDLLERMEELLDNDEAKLYRPKYGPVKQHMRSYVMDLYKKILPLTQEVAKLSANERTMFNELLAALEVCQGKNR